MVSNGEAIELLRNIFKILSDPDDKPTKFTYALVKNMRKLERIQKDAQDTLSRAEDDDYNEFVEALKPTKTRFAKINGNDQPLTDPDGEIVIDPAKMADYERTAKEVADSNEKWKVALDNRQNVVKDLLEADSGFSPFMLKVEFLPDTIKTQDFIALTPLIEGIDE